MAEEPRRRAVAPLVSKGGEGRLRFARIWAETDGGTPAMEGAGGHEGRCGLVQGVHGREREPKEWRRGSGVTLNIRGRGAPRGHALASSLPSPRVTGARRGVSGVFVGSVQS